MQTSRNAATNGKAEGNSTDRTERANRKEVQRVGLYIKRVGWFMLTVGGMVSWGLDTDNLSK